MVRPFNVLVEGNIGSGKSQFLNRFQNMAHVDILQAGEGESASTSTPIPPPAIIPVWWSLIKATDQGPFSAPPVVENLTDNRLLNLNELMKRKVIN